MDSDRARFDFALIFLPGAMGLGYKVGSVKVNWMGSVRARHAVRIM